MSQPKRKYTGFAIVAITGVLLLLCAHIFELIRNWKIGSCERDNTLIFYQYKTDYEIGCAGISRAEGFFEQFGFSSDAPITLFIEKHVPFDQEIYEPGQLLGYVNIRSLYALTPSYISSLFKRRRNTFFEIKTDSNSDLKELLISTVAHEVAHLLAVHNFELFTPPPQGFSPRAQMSNGVQEYIASIVQFSSMKEEFRQRVVESFDKKLMFSDELQINSLLFYHSPQKFYIMSYRHFNSLDYIRQREILERIFTNALNPDSLLDIEL